MFRLALCSLLFHLCFSQKDPSRCGEPDLKFRECGEGAEMKILFHYNKQIGRCLLWTSSCPNVPHTFKTLKECETTCYAEDFAVCRNPLEGVKCSPEWVHPIHVRPKWAQPCPEDYVCKIGSPEGSCCPRDEEEWFKMAYSDKCPGDLPAALIEKGNFKFPYISHVCEELECPSGFECVEINDLFVKCCSNAKQELPLGGVLTTVRPRPDQIPRLVTGEPRSAYDNYDCNGRREVDNCEEPFDAYENYWSWDSTLEECTAFRPRCADDAPNKFNTKNDCETVCKYAFPNTREGETETETGTLTGVGERGVDPEFGAAADAEVEDLFTDEEIDERCSGGRVWNDCGTACPEYCGQGPGPRPCTLQCVPGCYCKAPLIQETNEPDSFCVERSECDPDAGEATEEGVGTATEEEDDFKERCGEDKVWNDCGSACPEYCGQKPGPRPCTRQCVPGCYCKPPFILESMEPDSFCVERSECDAGTEEDEKTPELPPDDPDVTETPIDDETEEETTEEPTTEEEVEDDIDTSTDEIPEGDKGICDDPDKEWGECDKKCAPTCEDPQGTRQECKATCEQNCHCIGSLILVKDDPESACINLSECGLEFDTNIDDEGFEEEDEDYPTDAEDEDGEDEVDPDETCDKYDNQVFDSLAPGCPLTCNRRQAEYCDEEPSPGCVCVYPFIRLSEDSEECVRESECPTLIKPIGLPDTFERPEPEQVAQTCSDPNKYWEKCASGCPQFCGEGEESGKPAVECSLDGGCTGRCVCKHPMILERASPDAGCIHPSACGSGRRPVTGPIWGAATTKKPWGARTQKPSWQGGSGDGGTPGEGKDGKPWEFTYATPPRPANRLKGVCRDERSECPVWAKNGDCQKNSGWMLLHCQKSCDCCGCTFGDLFNAQRSNPCEDRVDTCPIWAKFNQCRDNPEYMEIYCRTSCNICSPQKQKQK